MPDQAELYRPWEFRFQWDTNINGQHTRTQKITACLHASNNMLEKSILFIIAIKTMSRKKNLNNRICIKEGNYNILLQKVRETLNKYHIPRWKKYKCPFYPNQLKTVAIPNKILTFLYYCKVILKYAKGDFTLSDILIYYKAQNKNSTIGGNNRAM